MTGPTGKIYNIASEETEEKHYISLSSFTKVSRDSLGLAGCHSGDRHLL